jgi:hypothetical protein
MANFVCTKCYAPGATTGPGSEVRGGSWNNNRRNVRCAYRNRNVPDNFNNNVGFRVFSHDPQARPVNFDLHGGEMAPQSMRASVARSRLTITRQAGVSQISPEAGYRRGPPPLVVIS